MLIFYVEKMKVSSSTICSAKTLRTYFGDLSVFMILDCSIKLLKIVLFCNI